MSIPKKYLTASYLKHASDRNLSSLSWASISKKLNRYGKPFGMHSFIAEPSKYNLMFFSVSFKVGDEKHSIELGFEGDKKMSVFNGSSSVIYNDRTTNIKLGSVLPFFSKDLAKDIMELILKARPSDWWCHAFIGNTIARLYRMVDGEEYLDDGLIHFPFVDQTYVLLWTGKNYSFDWTGSGKWDKPSERELMWDQSKYPAPVDEFPSTNFSATSMSAKTIYSWAKSKGLTK